MARTLKTNSTVATKSIERSGIRCAIYTRKSTEEGLDQAFNSLDAQREAAEAYITSQRHENWIPVATRYDDGGFTGANMERPALNRLLEDVRAGRINCVLVHRVDRLTRSLFDFSRIIDTLDENGVSFVSVTQQFNTTSSLGRLTLNILLSFAQFEREMISERTRDKMSAARRKGKWIGGNLLLGYDLLPAGRGLVVNEAEAEQIRQIYGLYLERQSLRDVVEELDRRGWRTKTWVTKDGKPTGGKPFVKNILYNLLTNIAYTGRIKFEDQIYAGEQTAIVDSGLWNRVQKLLNGNGRKGGSGLPNKYGAVLKGILRCANCDVRMVHTYTPKGSRVYRYYVCSKAHQRGWNTCETRSVSAPEIEQAVVAQIRAVANDPRVRQRVLMQVEAQRKDQAGSPSNVDLGSQLERALKDFDPLWEQMSTTERERFVRALVGHVTYDGKTGTVTLGFKSAGIKAICDGRFAQGGA